MKLTKKEIAEAVSEPDWQEFRLTLKGLQTEAKLRELDIWLLSTPNWSYALIQVQNYLNALARGGQIESLDKSRPLYQQIMSAKVRR